MLTNTDIQRIGELMDSRLEASEKRLMQYAKTSENRVIKQVGQFINDAILPQLEDKADQDEVSQLSKRVDDIEKLPVIVHELKIKK